MNNNKVVKVLHAIALIASFLGMIVFTVGYSFGWMILAIGAFLLVMVRLYMRAKAVDKLLMRQLSILLFGAAFLLGSAYLMKEGKNYWVIPQMIDAVIELYVSFRVDNDK